MVFVSGFNRQREPRHIHFLELSFEDDLTTYHKDGNTHSIQTSVLFIRIDIQNLDHPLTQEVDLSIQRPYVTFPDEPVVNVTLNVETVLKTTTLEGVALRVTGPESERCSVDVHSVSVTISGPKTLVDALEPRSIFATVNCSIYSAQGPGLYLPEPQIKNLAAPMAVVTTDPLTLQLEVAELPEPPPPIEGSGEFDASEESDLAPIDSGEEDD